MRESEQLYLEALKRASLKSFYKFAKEMWEWVDPEPFKEGPHFKVVCDHLQAVYERKIINLLINIPPGYAKSILCNVLFPAWVWLKDPSHRLLCAAGVDELATRDSVKCRRLINSQIYGYLKSFNLMGDQDTKTRFDNDKMGFRYALSVNGHSTGERGHIRVIDDPHKAKDIHSKTIRQGVLIWFDQEFSTRKNDPDKTCTIVIMQRLHYGDLSGHILTKGNYEHLCLPGIHDGVPRRTILGWYDPRQKGELLWPEVYGEQQMEQLRKDLGSFGFSGQIMQQPVSDEGGIIKKHWVKKYKELPELNNRSISLDCSFKDSDGSDYVAIQYWGQVGAKKYLIKRFRGRLDMPGTVALVREWAKNPYDRFLIEDKANGPAVISTIKKEIPRVIAITPKDSKEARLHYVSTDFEAGNVYFPEFEDTANLEHELTAFPVAEHDDEMDACSQYLADARKFETKYQVHNPKDKEVVSPLRRKNLAKMESYYT